MTWQFRYCLDGVQQCWTPTKSLNMEELGDWPEAGTFFLWAGIR